MYITPFQYLIKAVATVLLLSITVACQSEPTGPGMILSFGSVIDGRSIAVKSAKLPDGQLFNNPGSVGGGGTRKWKLWKLIPTKVEGASGDYRELPEWVEFEWSEPNYPEDPNMSLEAYRALPRKTQRLTIKNRIPQEVVDEVIESKRNAPKGQLSEKTLWIHIFWTPDGMKMRWEMKYDENHMSGGFGKVIKEGGDDLDRYNQ